VTCSGPRWPGSPRTLDIACAAFAQVVSALDGFAEVLAGAQHQMAGVRVDAEQIFGSLTEARAEQAELREPTDGEVAVAPPVAAAFQERRAALGGRIGRLEAAWEAELAAASGLRLGVLEAARHSASVIRAAGRTSPTAGQNWIQDRWDKTRRWASGQLDNLKDFVAEHAEVFRGVARALRVVGVALVVVGAVLAVLGVGGGVMAAGFLLWGAGDALDSTVDWAKGTISGRDLLIQSGTALGLSVVGGAAAKAGVKALERLGPKLHGWIDDVLKPMLADERGTWSMADRLSPSGARIRPRDLLDADGQRRWARDAYDSFLTDDRDTDTISRALAEARRPDGTSGYSPEEVAAVKRHLMLEEHRIEHPEAGRIEVRRFDPDEDIADAWIRLRAGRPFPRTSSWSTMSWRSCGICGTILEPRTGRRTRMPASCSTGSATFPNQPARTSRHPGGTPDGGPGLVPQVP
jgi:hypothetical protein